MWFPFLVSADVPDSVAAGLEDVAVAIRDASYLVRDTLKTARFEVTSGPDAGYPADPAVEEAIRDATIAQLRFWAETGDTTGAGAQVGGGSILSVSLPGGGGTTSTAAKREARIAPAVEEILRNAPGIAWEIQY